MASRYSKIQTSIWSSDKFSAVNEFAQRVYLYLLCCPHGNSAGFFRIPTGYALTDLRCSEKRYKNAIATLRDVGLISFVDEIVLVHQFLRFNPYMNASHAKGSNKEIKDLKSHPLYKPFLNEINTLCAGYFKYFSQPETECEHSVDTVSAECRHTNTNTNTNTNTVVVVSNDSGNTYSDGDDVSLPPQMRDPALAKLSNQLTAFYGRAPTPMEVDKAEFLREQYSGEWWAQALSEASDKGAHNMAYVKAKLEAWKSNGGPDKKRDGPEPSRYKPL